MITAICLCLCVEMIGKLNDSTNIHYIGVGAYFLANQFMTKLEMQPQTLHVLVQNCAHARIPPTQCLQYFY